MVSLANFPKNTKFFQKIEIYKLPASKNIFGKIKISKTAKIPKIDARSKLFSGKLSFSENSIFSKNRLKSQRLFCENFQKYAKIGKNRSKIPKND